MMQATGKMWSIGADLCKGFCGVNPIFNIPFAYFGGEIDDPHGFIIIHHSFLKFPETVSGSWKTKLNNETLQTAAADWLVACGHAW